MKICYLANAASVHTVKWVNEMACRKHEVYLISIDYPSNLIDKKVIFKQLIIPRPIGYYLNVVQLKNILKKIKPDLVNAHYAKGYGTLSRLVDFHPTLLSVWGGDVFVFPYKSKLKKRILEKNLAAADFIASTSHIMKRQTKKFITPKYPIMVTPFGTDPQN